MTTVDKRPFPLTLTTQDRSYPLTSVDICVHACVSMYVCVYINLLKIFFKIMVFCGKQKFNIFMPASSAFKH